MSDGGRYAAVAVPVPVRRLFTYRVDDALRDRVERGVRVRVPLGPRRVEGTVVEWPAAPPEGVQARAIDAVLPDRRRPTDELLELTRFVADYYLCSWGEAIEAALPPDPGPGARTRAVRRADCADPAALPARAVARRRLLEALPADGRPVPLGGLGTADRRAARALERIGWVEVVELDDDAIEDDDERAEGTPGAPAAGPTPTAAQAAALAEIDPVLESGVYAPFLLFGATGSGKTEVYLRAAARALAAGRGVIYLVPEIGLTPLLVSKIRHRFPGTVALLHSGVPRRRRHAIWQRVREGRLRLVVGARSAIFAPVGRLGLIVVDEEQDGSYKQEETPRYNARDLALVRARSAGAVALLGSATPSLESFRHAGAGRYRLLRLGGRIERRPLAQVTLVDMRSEYQRAGEIRPLSAALAQALRECVSRGEQALVLRNRRGWSASVFCPRCGERVGCDRCSVTLTWHLAARRLRCHYCGREHAFPECCPRCGAAELKLLGEGTEQIEALIRAEVPAARIARMDRDAVRRRGAQERLLQRFDRGELDVLVGTQMIAKGHDFTRVTLVGVLSADQTLGLPDFRAAERLFQLLTQVAGRAGRGERPGSVLVQVFDPDHPLLRQAARQDYESFYEREIRYRRALRYPPLSALVQLVVADRDEFRAREWAELLAAALRRESAGKLIVAGPGPAPLERLKGRWRQQILVRTSGRRRLIAAVESALAAVDGRVPRRALVVDVDPYSLL